LGTVFTVVGATSVPLIRICSMVFRYAPFSIPSNFNANSSVKSLEVNDFPATLSTLPSRLLNKPEILLYAILASSLISALTMLPLTAYEPSSPSKRHALPVHTNSLASYRITSPG